MYDMNVYEKLACSHSDKKEALSTLDKILELSEKAKCFGLLSLEQEIDAVQPEIFKKSIQKLIDGIEPESLREILMSLNAHMTALVYSGVYWLYVIFIS